MNKPTSAEKYDFVNSELSKLFAGQKTNVVMEGRVYEVKYRGLEHDVFLPIGEEGESA